MMEIEQHLWGMTPEGEAIVLYTMRNAQGAEVKLTNYGATIVAITVPDREGRMADVALGYKHPEGYFHDNAACGKSVGCFAEQVWESRVETNRVVMELLSDNSAPDKPGELHAQAIFDFDDDCSLEITYRARTNSTTPVDLTNRLYFNLSGEASGTVLDHELQLNSSLVPEINERQRPTGRLSDVTDTPQDFRKFQSLRTGIDAAYNHIRDFRGYAHSFVIEDWKPGILGIAGCLRDPQSGRQVEVLTSQPCVMIYTGNRLSDGCPETKSGSRYENHAGVAIECQNFPDAVNHPEFPSPLLHPGQTYCQKTVYRFGIF